MFFSFLIMQKNINGSQTLQEKISSQSNRNSKF